MSIRDQILAIPEGADLKSEPVDVPEWGDLKLVVREMTSKQRSSYTSAIMDRVDTEDGDVTLVFNPDNQQAKLVVRTVYDTDGNRVFTDDDAEAIGKRASSVVERLAAVASRLSAVDTKAAAEAGKDSAPTPDATSSSS